MASLNIYSSTLIPSFAHLIARRKNEDNFLVLGSLLGIRFITHQIFGAFSDYTLEAYRSSLTIKYEAQVEVVGISIVDPIFNARWKADNF